ncbi:hydroxymethylglutaryl-CoA reductase, degradative [Enterococcus dongliensis]|uniref:acetyl-CoA C-acetyltransferase n=1 Tax=Enterococcus dongliensis TaxID=2559925 RepID=A0AAP5KU93_9ENTE|nr:hydroxymethylglutaryl-CoA reductase, degradative [Enterococcus dongliensis]MDT2597949.1 hydroxymethylglutaryl-CoA reductase, degradative [Enterococcus dongliensis]MDT2604984.1 hydroxymethylglutaryl-CoA reductase, degradative [Enterococcus dongliensis]MDT2634286.1 hydroxymethylglutaryl-CoA reductase, degradative [Enterococcus dongliensis]MDT2636803.1 hydroxymethylglutaryl-CoA reductase, degradative [Enterococcus dongliensis]MDT2642103.1 hydroxymethylglutaryl-CoA reductase, degradative [Enter
MEEVVILSAVRTPIGRYKGKLAPISAVELAAIASKAAIKRAELVPDQVEQVFIGNVLQAGNGQNVARQAAVRAGIPHSTPATTINEVCGSGMKAIIFGMQQILLGEAQVVLAGGTENMSQAPKVTSFDYDTQEWQEPKSSMIYDGLTDAFSGEHMGLTAEKVAQEYHITRKAQDQYAYESQMKAANASTAGKFDSEIVPVALPDGRTMGEDEGIRYDSTLEKISSLKPAFKADGVVTAANASTLNDGASAIILAAKSYAIEHGLAYLAVINGYSEVGIDPSIMGMAPVSAINKLLKKVNRRIDEVDIFQINEAFASASVAVQKELKVPDQKINIYGGAIALGHPIGASGTRIVTTLVSELIQEEKQRGIASLCIGGGLGLALMITKAEDQETAQKKFYQMSQTERLAKLVKEKKITAKEAAQLANQMVLPEEVATNLIENQISEYSIPLGVAQNFVINGKEKLIPMVTEEPSVIAAASNAGKIIAKAGGLTTHVLSQEMIGQIVLQNVTEVEKIKKILSENESLLFSAAQESYPSIYQRGGGLRAINIRTFEAGYLSIDLVVDTKDAMGANILNTMLEAVAQELRELILDVDILFSILSNYATHALIEARCEIPVKQLTPAIAKKIVAASDYSKLDPYRAATNNKGIMNGIDAVVLATGNDTRAVAAACHAYAARNGRYEGLTDWSIQNDQLIGTLVLPLKVGIVGGATKVLPKAQLSLKLLEVSSAAELGEIIVAVGLAQNLAAVKALVTEGIQKGHMAMQSRSLAITAGATISEIPQVAKRLRNAQRMNLATAEEIIKNIRLG